MRHEVFSRVGLGLLIAAAGSVCSTGCTHNYYYTGVPGACGPTTVVPGAVTYGEVCEVPSSTTSGGTSVVTRTPTLTPSPTLGAARPPRVVVSEPGMRSTQRFGWRAADSDAGLATTRVEGNVDDGSLTR